MTQRMKRSSSTLHTLLLSVGIEEFVFGKMRKKSRAKLSRICQRKTKTLPYSLVTKMILCHAFTMVVSYSQVDMMELSWLGTLRLDLSNNNCTKMTLNAMLKKRVKNKIRSLILRSQNLSTVFLYWKRKTSCYQDQLMDGSDSGTLKT